MSPAVGVADLLTVPPFAVWQTTVLLCGVMVALPGGRLEQALGGLAVRMGTSTKAPASAGTPETVAM
jgi:hypothetical protein